MNNEERKTNWENALNVVFPDRWEIQKGSCNNYGSDFSTLVIHFPEFTISNDLELEHTVRDLFVKLNIHESYLLNAHPIGFRTTYRVKEFLMNYTHSHISALAVFNKNVDTNSFCLGASELNTLIRRLNNKYGDFNSDMTEEEILHFLFSLESYVAWESLEGGPYKKIEWLNDWNQIVQQLGQNTSNYYKITEADVRKYYKKVLPLLTNVETAVSGVKNNLLFNFNEVSLNEIFDKVNEIRCLKGTNYTVPETPQRVIDLIYKRLTEDEGTLKPFIFKGKEYPLVIHDLATFSFGEMDFGMPNILKKEVTKKLNYELNESGKKYLASQKN